MTGSGSADSFEGDCDQHQPEVLRLRAQLTRREKALHELNIRLSELELHQVERAIQDDTESLRNAQLIAQYEERMRALALRLLKAEEETEILRARVTSPAVVPAPKYKRGLMLLRRKCLSWYRRR
jgi:hypothetical protein